MISDPTKTKYIAVFSRPGVNPSSATVIVFIESMNDPEALVMARDFANHYGLNFEYLTTEIWTERK